MLFCLTKNKTWCHSTFTNLFSGYMARWKDVLWNQISHSKKNSRTWSM